MSIASKVAARKEKYPHLYCPTPRCLWHTSGGVACPRHSVPKPPPADPLKNALGGYPDVNTYYAEREGQERQ